MNKTLLVFRNEFIYTITRRSFIITLLLIPLASIIITLFIKVSNQQGSSSILNQILAAPVTSASIGYIDESGLIKSVPSWQEFTSLQSFTDQAHANQAFSSGKISGYFIIPADYVKTGNIYQVLANYSPLSGGSNSQAIKDLLTYNLLNGDQQLTFRIENPINQIQTTTLGTTTPQREGSNMLTFFLPYIVTMIFYIIILTASSLMLNSLTTEKQNRMMEILMVSITPTQMLTGKIAALGLVGLLQTLVWTGTGYGLLVFSKSAFNVSAAFQLPFSILIWGLLFFLLGYALYASFMAGIGALVSNLREASQTTTLIIIPLIIPLLLLNIIVNDPNGSLSMFLSLFPLTAPVAMMARLSVVAVPIWQIILSAIILAISAFFAVKAIAGMFRAQTLITNQEFKFGFFIKALMGKI